MKIADEVSFDKVAEAIETSGEMVSESLSNIAMTHKAHGDLLGTSLTKGARESFEDAMAALGANASTAATAGAKRQKGES